MFHKYPDTYVTSVPPDQIYDSHEIPLDDPHTYFKFHIPLRVSSDVKIAV